MSATAALSFYQIQVANAPLSITYAFDALSKDDISVIAIATNDYRTSLTEGTDYSIDFDNKTITCLESSWDAIPEVYVNSNLRIYRTTSVLPLIDFKAGAVLSEGDLDNAYKQGLFAAQEAVEDAAATGAGLQSVTEAHIENGAVTTSKIAGGAVTGIQIASSTIDDSKLKDNTVTNAKIATNAITNIKIVNDSISKEKIVNGAVTTPKIDDGAVTQVKVAKASQANMQAQSGTDGVVTPDVLKYSPFAPRCYGSVSYDTGSESFSPGSYNVASVTNTANNKRTITFSTPMLDTDYFVSVTGTATSASTNFYATVTSKTVNGFVIDGAGTDEADELGFDFVVFGSTLNES